MFKPGDKVTALAMVPGETPARGEVVEVQPGRYSYGSARTTGVQVRWTTDGGQYVEWVNAALLTLDNVVEKPITFAQYLGMPEAPRDDYAVDDTDPYQDLLYLSDYHRAVEWVQAQYAYHAEWERELLYNPGDVERADSDWASEWLTAFRALWPHEQVVGYFV